MPHSPFLACHICPCFPIWASDICSKRKKLRAINNNINLKMWLSSSKLSSYLLAVLVLCSTNICLSSNLFSYLWPSPQDQLLHIIKQALFPPELWISTSRGSDWTQPRDWGRIASIHFCLGSFFTSDHGCAVIKGVRWGHHLSWSRGVSSFLGQLGSSHLLDI